LIVRPFSGKPKASAEKISSETKALSADAFGL
jgi:hypothetical protein